MRVAPACAVALGALVWAGSAGAEDLGWARDPIPVYFDGAACEGAEIDVQVWDRGAGAWRAHPIHPHVAVPSCQIEDAGWLFNELRWRCRAGDVDNPWRGFQVFGSGALTRCSDEAYLEAERERIRATRRKLLELHIEEPEPAPEGEPVP